MAKALSLLAIPVVLAMGGWVLQHTIARQSVDQEYVQLAVDILSDAEGGGTASLRKWAVELLNEKSPVSFGAVTASELESGAISLPGGIRSSRGREFASDFVEGLFTSWDSEVALSDEFRAILIVLADDMVKHHWQRVATNFAPDYYYEQLSLLAEGRPGLDGLRSAVKQFVREAMFSRFQIEGAGDTKPELDRIIRIEYMGITESFMGGETQQIEFRFYQDDGAVFSGGFIYDRDSYYFLGAYG